MAFKLTLITCFCLSHLQAAPGFHEPWGTDADLHHSISLPSEPSIKASPLSSRRSPMVRAVEQVIRFHQEIISPVDGPRSHFRPSSSQYMMQAVQKHGFLQGFLMGCDRLLRENSDKWVYQEIEYEGALYKWDPPP
jgi:uncharacterized protein